MPCLQILQIAEVLLKKGDLLTKCSDLELPKASPAAIFLCSLLEACKGKPQLGRIIQVPLPDVRANISPQHRIPGLHSRNERPLLR